MESDAFCEEKGIPCHLHRCERDADQDFSDPEEALSRRVEFAHFDLTNAIKFDRMSVNRDKFCKETDDVIWNADEGGRHQGVAVATFQIKDFLGREWKHPDQEVFYSLKPIHKPEKCNFPHTEVVVNKREGDVTEEVDVIKPSSIRLKIREHFGTSLCIVWPADMVGKKLPLK